MNFPSKRNDIPQFLDCLGAKVGVELGVAQGWFSAHLVKFSHLDVLYSIDRWAFDRGHDAQQYFDAVNALKKYKDRSIVLRLEFHDALGLFPDNFFDFIYIDGYAGTGQDDGHTLREWYPKLKQRGLFSGHDYCCIHYGENVKIIDKFIKEHQLEMYLTKDDPLPSWMVIKP